MTSAEQALMYPHVSIVVPVYNRVHYLDALLSSLMAQSYPLDRYAIILVDDGSTDATVVTAQSILNKWSGQWEIVVKENGGPASARNAGWRKASSDIIAFIDSDCVAATDWLMSMATAIEQTHADGIGGPLVNSIAPGWTANYLQAAEFFRHRVKNGKVDYLLTANVAYRRAALEAVNGFSEQKGIWGEDADLSFRLQQAGFSLAVTDQGIVTHFGTPASVRSLVTDLYRYGRGNAMLSHNWQNHRSPLVEMIRHGGAVLLSPVLMSSYIPKVGLWQALSFWPLIVIEHSAFVFGVFSAVIDTERKAGVA